MIITINNINELDTLYKMFPNLLKKYENIFLTIINDKNSLNDIEYSISKYSKRLDCDNYYNLILLTSLDFDILNKYFEEFNVFPTTYYFKKGFLESIIEGYIKKL